ncbi:glycosyl hydrolase family 18 protein [Bacteroides sp. 51]|uniref:glycosyl hydrolase family 18 protein n=1 Tax=Bacteroides sp. 51 TaxID=2302938 RepID=UPI0013CFC843|nr:glycosyl hydrolase family 18 protein [Bacteroides sp. 51]NDV84312.1 hypothetical protein [Bacteroides sp. 51]
MKKSSILILALLSILFMGACSPQKKTIQDIAQQPYIVAYLPTWRMPYTPDWDKITHLCLAFGFVNADGSLRMEEIIKNKYIIEEAQKHKVSVLLSIGGGGSKNFAPAILDAETRTALVNNLKKIITEYNLDGVDVDYEEWEGGPNGASEKDIECRTALELLYKELREALGSTKLITAAVNAGWDNGGGFGLYNCFNESMHQYLDFVSLMIYDETGPWSGERTGPHSDWTFFEKAIDHWLNNRKLPKEKLIAGVPFYGYHFLSPNDATGARGIPYRDILTQYPDEDAHLQDSIGLLYYDGIPTIKRKAEYIKQHQLGGIMFWEITQDTDIAEKSLLNTIYNVLR